MNKEVPGIYTRYHTYCFVGWTSFSAPECTFFLPHSTHNNRVHIKLFNPFPTPVPFWGQITGNSEQFVLQTEL